MYPPSAIRLPKEPPEDLKNKPAEALRYNRHDENLTEEAKRQAVAAYYASVSYMDAQVGVLLDVMNELKLWDSTVVVVFFGDHGFHLGEHGGLWRKLTLFEEPARAPLIVHAPDKGEGKTSNRLVEFVDFYSMLTELCGLPAPSGMEGASFVPLLTDQTRPWKQAVFIQVPLDGVRSGAAEREVIGQAVTTERRYFIGSLPADAKQALRAVRGKWQVENSLHWVLGVAFREDACRTRTGNAPENLATLRHIAVNLSR